MKVQAIISSLLGIVKSLWIAVHACMNDENVHVLFVWFDSLRISQQLFSYAGMGLPGLNQY